jgi:hypothetical protein
VGASIPLTRFTQHVFVAAGFNPVGAHDLAGSIEPVESIRRQARWIPQSVMQSYHIEPDQGFTCVTRTIGFPADL